MRKVNLVGQTFNRLTVIEELPSIDLKSKRPAWKCVCSCKDKNIVIVRRGNALKRGAIQSCGCLRSETSSKHLTKVAFEKRLYEPQEASARTVYYRSYCKNKDTITYEEFFVMSQMNCFYCGNQPSNINDAIFSYSSDYYKENCSFTYNGLDRFDNNLPHTIDNCVPCCFECNTSKRNMTFKDFKNMVIRIYKIRNKAIPNFDELFENNTADLSHFDRIRGRTINRSYYEDVDFTDEMFFFIISMECFYCNNPGSNGSKCKNGDRIFHNGLDKINQELPHTLENVIHCCKYCNWSKAKRSKDNFISWATRVYNNLFS